MVRLADGLNTGSRNRLPHVPTIGTDSLRGSAGEIKAMLLHYYPPGYVSSSDAVFFLAFGHFKAEPDIEQFVRDGWKQPGWVNDKIRRYLRYKLRGLPCPPEMINGEDDSARIVNETETLLRQHKLTECELRRALVDAAWMTYRYNQHMAKAELFLAGKLQTGALAIEAEYVPWGSGHGNRKVETIPPERLNDGELAGLRSQNLFIKGKSQLGNWHYPRLNRADIERLAAVAAADMKTTKENKEQRAAVANTPLTKEHVTATETVLWILNKKWLSYAEWEDQHRAADLFWDVPDEFVYRVQRFENGGNLPGATLYDFNKKTLSRYAQVKAEGRDWNPGTEQAGEFGTKSEQALQQWFAGFCTKNDIECDYKILASKVGNTIEARGKAEAEIQTAFAELCCKLRDGQLKMTGRPALTNGVQQVIPSDAFRLPNMLLIAQLNRTYTEGRNTDFEKNDWVDLALLRSEVEKAWPRQIGQSVTKEAEDNKVSLDEATSFIVTSAKQNNGIIPARDGFAQKAIQHFNGQGKTLTSTIYRAAHGRVREQAKTYCVTPAQAGKKRKA